MLSRCFEAPVVALKLGPVVMEALEGMWLSEAFN